MANNNYDPTRFNVPIIGEPEPEAHAVGGLGVKTNGSPQQILAQAGEMSLDTSALLVAVSLELKLRDAEIAGLRAMLDSLTTVAETGLGTLLELEQRIEDLEGFNPEIAGREPEPDGKVAGWANCEDAPAGAPMALPTNGTTRIELDPDELDRDYRERIAKCERYSREQGMAWHMLCKLAKVEPALTRDEGQVVLENLRKLEAYLDAHGGPAWPPE